VEALQHLDTLALSPEEKQKLFHDNARRILGLRSQNTPAVSDRVA
jgi:predicted TIM-barrel fold metal-dependent hydrolase